MLPIGLLMIEHRLIERMIKQMARELERVKAGEEVDLAFIDEAVDFIRVYADRCHHGKEEDILFRGLAGKTLSTEHRRIMEELIQEHKWGRESVSKLAAARQRCQQGDRAAAPEIMAQLEKLCQFYPRHIEKEDKRFFIPCMDYFTDQEKKDMLQESYDFDKGLIHEKYRDVVEKTEKR